MNNLFRNLYERINRRMITRREEETARRAAAAARLETETIAALQQENLAWAQFLVFSEENLAQLGSMHEQLDDLDLLFDQLQRQLQVPQQEGNVEVRSAAIRSLFPRLEVGELDADCRNCIICQEAYGNGEDDCPEPVRLRCCAPATAGLTCLMVWLLDRGTCPLCRRDWRGEIRRVVEELEGANPVAQ